MFWAGPGRAGADRATDERGAVLRADAAGMALGHQIAGVRAATSEEVGERLTEMAMQAPQLGRRQRARRPGGVEPGPPQRLVGDEVAHAGQPRLIEQPRL